MRKSSILVTGILISFMMVLQPVCADDISASPEKLRQGHGKELIPVLNKALISEPDSPRLWNNLAIAYIQAGRYEDAAKSFDTAATVKPVYKTIYGNRQKLLDYMAARAYQKALGNKQKPPMPGFDVLDLKGPAEAPAPTPVAEKQPPVSAPQQKSDSGTIIRQMIQQWADAWKRGDVDNYLSMYSKDFLPGDGRNFNQWSEARRNKLRFVNVERLAISNENLFLGTDGKRVLARFVQAYKASNYQDRVLKQLEWIKQPQGWKILHETVLETLE